MKKLLATILLLLVTTPSHAQQAPPQGGFKIQVQLACNTTDSILKILKEKYREVATGGGMSRTEQVRLFESHDAGDKQTWTIVISGPNGMSCIIRGGEDWIDFPEIIKGDAT